MARKPQSVQRTADQHLDGDDRVSGRLAEYQIDWVDYAGNRIGRFGGLFDRKAREYIGDAGHSRVVRMHPGQEAAARWFNDWLGEHLGIIERVGPPTFHTLCAGGRRGGKSHFITNAVAAYITAVPDAIGWLVAPADSFYEELIGYVEECWPRWWYESLGAPHWTFFHGNGSKLTMRSGYTPRKLKKGRADIVGLNEAQQLKEQSMATVAASVVDVGGVLLSAANPPDVGDEGTWVADFAAECDRGLRNHAKFFFLDPELNPEIDQTALRALAESMSEHEYRIQVRGEFLLPPDAVLHAWDKVENERPVPRAGVDITKAFTTKFEGREFDEFWSIDVQNYPWIAAVRWKVFLNPRFPGIVERGLIWGVDEVFMEQADEVVVAQNMLAMGADPERTLVIMDASCDWQQQARKEELQPVRYRGKGSMDIFRGEGFVWVVPPDRYMDANPEIIDRCRAANARIGAASGSRYIMVDPDRCPKTCASIRHWKVINGRPSRHSKHAHGGDAVTYMSWRFFPRRREEGTLVVTQLPNRTTPRTRGP